MGLGSGDLLTRPEAAEILRTSPATLSYWAWQGKGPKSFRVGRRVLYARADLEEFLARARENS